MGESGSGRKRERRGGVKERRGGVKERREGLNRGRGYSEELRR